MTSPEDFTPYARLADELIGKGAKDQLADVARLLAGVGNLPNGYGKLSIIVPLIVRPRHGRPRLASSEALLA